jgi:hypothetical protein
MFDQLPPQQIAFIDRMKGKERSAQNVAVGRAEIDAIAQVLVDLFNKNGVHIDSEQQDTGVVLTIKYPPDAHCTTTYLQPLPPTSTQGTLLMPTSMGRQHTPTRQRKMAEATGNQAPRQPHLRTPRLPATSRPGRPHHPPRRGPHPPLRLVEPAEPVPTPPHTQDNPRRPTRQNQSEVTQNDSKRL